MNKNGLARQVLLRSSFIKLRNIRVIPHPGHFNPVTVLKKHGIQKDVYRTKQA